MAIFGAGLHFELGSWLIKRSRLEFDASAIGISCLALALLYALTLALALVCMAYTPPAYPSPSSTLHPNPNPDRLTHRPHAYHGIHIFCNHGSAARVRATAEVANPAEVCAPRAEVAGIGTRPDTGSRGYRGRWPIGTPHLEGRGGVRSRFCFQTVVALGLGLGLRMC